MNAQAFGGTDRVERGFDITGDAEIAAMDMERVGDPELLQCAGERDNDLPRSHVVIDVLLIEIEFALVELKSADAAGIDHLDGDRLRRMHGPGAVVLDGREVLFRRKLAEKEIVG